VWCPAGWYLNDNCYVNTGTSCLAFSLTSNGCAACPAGFSLANGGSCYSTDCATYGAAPDTCDSCNTGFWLSDGHCFAVTATNCASFETTSNACESCPANFWLGADGNCYAVCV
jgi:hypothetical protein